MQPLKYICLYHNFGVDYFIIIIMICVDYFIIIIMIIIIYLLLLITEFLADKPITNK